MWPPPSTPGPFGTSRLWCWRRRSHAHKVNGQDNRSMTKRRRIMWYINTVPRTSGLTKIISANGNLRSSVSLVLSWLLFLDKNSHKTHTMSRADLTVGCNQAVSNVLTSSCTVHTHHITFWPWQTGGWVEKWQVSEHFLHQLKCLVTAL